MRRVTSLLLTVVSTSLFTVCVMTQFSLAAIDPVDAVNPFIGTSTEPNADDTLTFPGADSPFGMVQFSPETSSGGGLYVYDDTRMLGFGLTHLSGVGCAALSEFRISPVTGVTGDPGEASAPFSHADETASPGYYAVAFPDSHIRTELTVTRRTGLAAIDFGTNKKGTVLFNVSASAAQVYPSSVRIVGANEIEGSASSGQFCYGSPDVHNIYVIAQFNRNFRSHGVWNGSRLVPGSDSMRGPHIGAWVGFDTSTKTRVRVKIGVSFVSLAGARKNLAAEATSWDVPTVRDRVANDWRSQLKRIQISGGTTAEHRIFYTALYHAMLHPNVISDVDGAYTGFDFAVHHTVANHIEHANYSGWDVYRTQTPLIAFLAPDRASDMVNSLLDAAREGGWLPKWSLVNGYTGVMVGDSADPMIAGSFAFGARAFDCSSALRAMVNGASNTGGVPGQGWYIERPNLAEYLRLGYVPDHYHTNSFWPVHNGASETLEYAIDDFSIAQLAKSCRSMGVYRRFLQRSQNWSNLFNKSTGSIAPRDDAGAFVTGPYTDLGQTGFQEGNSAQYTWEVPQDLRGLVRAIGGDAIAISKLDQFFQVLNGNAGEPYAWLGNEPSIGVPWVYLSAGAPWRAQAVLRSALTTLYDDAPAGVPGNDDLGTMSAWYVWNAAGLYPQAPAAPFLDIGTPLFSRITMHSPSGVTIDISAPGASHRNAYVQSLRIDKTVWRKSWFTLPQSGTVRLNISVGPNPNYTWARDRADRPPSFEVSALRFPGSTRTRMQAAASTIFLSLGQGTTLRVRFDNTEGRNPEAVRWHLAISRGFVGGKRAGSLRLAAGQALTLSIPLQAAPNLASGFYQARIDASASDAKLPPASVALRVRGGRAYDEMAFVESTYDKTVTPVDMSTLSVGVPITLPKNPTALAFDARHDRLFVATRQSNVLSVIDANRDEVVSSVALGGPTGVLHASADGKTLWYLQANHLIPLNIETLNIGPGVPLAADAREFALSHDSATAYVLTRDPAMVTPIELSTGKAKAPMAIDIDGSTIAISANDKRLVAVDSTSGTTQTIDLITLRKTRPLFAGSGARAVAIAPDGSRFYVANRYAGTVAFLSLETGSRNSTVRIGNNAYDVIVNRAGTRIVILDDADDECVVVDAKSGRILKRLTVGSQPRAIVL